MFLWRDKERGADDQEQDGEVINLKLAKHRNGPTGEIQLWFKKSQTRFVSYAGGALRRSRLGANRLLRLVGQQRPQRERVGLAVVGADQGRPWKPPWTGSMPSASTSSAVRTRAGSREGVRIGLRHEVRRRDVGPRPRLRVRGAWLAVEQDAAVALGLVHLGREGAAVVEVVEPLGQPGEGGPGRPRPAGPAASMPSA